MKSMAQMQNEMLSECKWDGSYPKVVIMGMGCIAIARNKEEYESLSKDSIMALLYGTSLGVILSIFIYFVLK